MVSISFAFWKDTNNLAGAVKQYRNGKDFAMPDVDIAAELQPLNPAQLAASANVVQTVPGGQTSRDRFQDDLLIDRVRYAAVADQVLNLFIEESWDNATWTATWSSGNTTTGQVMDSNWITLSKRWWRLRAVNTSGTTATTTFAAWEALSGGHSVPRAFYLGIGDSVEGGGSAAAPAASAIIAATPSLNIGTYEIVVTTFFSAGAPVATDMVNMKLFVGGVAVANFGPFVTPPALNVATSRRIARVTLTASAALQVAAIGAATAGVTYVAEIIATRVA